ncbi:MAG: methyltransferase domain-containing protein [Thermoplasmata archaeon]|nr:methyltransferase domain-containing protein [Thermoplasmata archaeon]
MRAWAVGVPAQDAEATRRRLQDAGLLRSGLRLLRRDGRVWIPVQGGGTPPKVADAVEMEFPEPPTPRPRGYQELVEVPASLRPELPRAFDVVGEVVLLRIPSSLRPYGPAIGSALLDFVPGARLVGEDRGVFGPERTRRLLRLAGDGSFVTVHRENGLEIEVDLAQAYFSPRLAREHERIAGEVRAGESVLDLCCGVAPFALTIARRHPSCRLVAVDVNPRAIELVESNLLRNRCRARVTPIAQDAAKFLESAPAFDRIVLNLPHEGHRFFPGIARALPPGGTLHYYAILSRNDASAELAPRLGALGPAEQWHVTGRHRVHAYSPDQDLVSIEIKRAHV